MEHIASDARQCVKLCLVLAPTVIGEIVGGKERVHVGCDRQVVVFAVFCVTKNHHIFGDRLGGGDLAATGGCKKAKLDQAAEGANVVGGAPDGFEFIVGKTALACPVFGRRVEHGHR